MIIVSQLLLKQIFLSDQFVFFIVLQAEIIIIVSENYFITIIATYVLLSPHSKRKFSINSNLKVSFILS